MRFSSGLNGITNSSVHKKKGMEDQMPKGITPQKFLSSLEMKVLKIIFKV